MEFYIEKHSTTPIVNQIEEQIKLAVMMGIFRNGDTLPSIRDIEKQTGVNRSQIHKAYLALRQSGLLVLTRGKGTVVATAANSPLSIDEKCRKLSGKIVSTVRRLGISPTAFGRYLGRYAQESERNVPFLLYVDRNNEMATQRASEISQLWQVPVLGVSYQELKKTIKGVGRQKILVNHFMCEEIRSLLPGRKSAIIPIEVRGSEQSIRDLDQIKPNASLLLLHLPQPSHRIRFIVAQMRKKLTSPEIKITTASVRDMSSFRKLLNESQYDFCLVGPSLLGEIPSEFRQDPRIIQLQTHLDRASLEAARIRAGVVI